jgi:pseudaminic acid cytidylyltransferase
MKIAVIPARGGSKRIPRKNIKAFFGKPVIAWSINAALSCKLFDKVIVSTDDEEISGVASRFGAEVPFIRPTELSNDYASTTEVIDHATQWALGQGHDVQAVCCIYATAPFVQADDLRRGWEALEGGDWDFAFSATEFSAPIFRSFRRLPNDGIEMFFPEYFLSRSQDLPAALHDAGQFYWGRPYAWTERRRVFDRRSVPVIIPRWRVQDIDTEEDWIRAELMFQASETLFNQG